MNEYASTIQVIDTAQQRFINSFFKKLCAQFGLAMLLLFLAFFLTPDGVVAQTGTIIGEVRDATSGEPIEGARINLHESGKSTTSDAEGRFILRRVPAHRHIVTIHHLGYETQDVQISLRPDEQLLLSVTLDSKAVVGEKVLVIARRNEQVTAWNFQKESTNYTSVYPYEQMDRFADYTVEDAMARIPGVQVGANREINLRGAGLNRYKVNFEGQRMATTGLGNRNIGLADISSDIVHKLEVVKVLTSDMDADAVAGTVNIRSFRNPGDERLLNARLGLQAEPYFFDLTGPGNRASLNYSEWVRDDISLSAFLSYQLDNRGWESLRTEFDVANFGGGNLDVIESVAPGLNASQSGRLGGGVRLLFQSSERTSYHLKGFLNVHNNQITRHRNVMAAGRDWISPDSTGAQENQGSFTYDVNFHDINVQQYMVGVGAKTLYDSFDLKYNLGWSHGRNSYRRYLFPFIRSGMNYLIDMQNRFRPTMQMTNIRLMEDGTIDRRLIFFDNLDYANDTHKDNTFTGNIDLDIPVGMASFKLGSSAIITLKDGQARNANYSHRRIDQFRFNQSRGNEVFDKEEYSIPWFVDARRARSFFNASRPQFNRDDVQYQKSDIGSYTATEVVLAGYGMTTFELGPVRLLAGARVEHAQNEYKGQQITFNEAGAFEMSIETSQTVDHTHVFPNAQLIFSPGSGNNLRLAYSKSIDRPDFNRLAPFELKLAQDSLLYRGNPGLNPVLSNNFDLIFEQYFGNVSAISVGLFYKELSDFMFERERTIAEGEYSGWQEISFFNGQETATLYGIELSWQQNLVFLPGFLKNFSTYANYTWSHSIFDVDNREDEIRLPWQSPHAVNVALDYSQGRFYTQLAYHWTAPALKEISDAPRMAPSVNPTREVYVDRYQDGWRELSLSMQFRISNHFRLWSDVVNILGFDRVLYDDSRDLYPVGIDKKGMHRINVGIRYHM